MSEEDFKPHMMYHPETGEGVMADTYEKHLSLAEEGYGHEPPAEKAEEVDADHCDAADHCDCDHEAGESCEECELTTTKTTTARCHTTLKLLKFLCQGWPQEEG